MTTNYEQITLVFDWSGGLAIFDWIWYSINKTRKSFSGKKHSTTAFAQGESESANEKDRKRQQAREDSMRYSERSTRNLVTAAVLMIVAIIVLSTVACGGGGTPTEPKVTPTPTPPVQVTPSVTFISATPPCGSTIKGSDFPAITFRVQYVTNTQSFISANLLFADGTGTGLLTDGTTGRVDAGSGFVNLSTGNAMKTGTTSTVLISMNAGNIGGKLLASDNPACSFIVQ